MSVSKVSHILDRISVATENSPIAVFRTPSNCDGLDAIFANTIQGQKRIKIDADDLIGVFDNFGFFNEQAIIKNKLNAELNIPAICRNGY